MDTQPWLQQVDEDDKWYGRFLQYLALGSRRSVRAVYNMELEARGKPSERSKSVPSSWTASSGRYQWVLRARAYDKWQIKSFLEAPQEGKIIEITGDQTEELSTMLKEIEVAWTKLTKVQNTIGRTIKGDVSALRGAIEIGRSIQNKLETLEARIAKLEEQTQQSIEPLLHKNALVVPDAVLPEGFSWLNEFADRHGIPLSKAETLYHTGVIYGQRITVSKRRSFIAIEARGQRDFWVQFHADTDFRPCNECPHS